VAQSGQSDLMPSEQTACALLPLWGGVELLRATYVTHAFSRHFHEQYALGCIERGALRFRYLGERHLASEGLVNLVVPGEAHDGCAATPEGWTYRMFYLPCAALDAAATELSGARAAPHFRQGVLRDPGLAAGIRAVHRLLQRPELSLLEKETRLLGLLTSWIARHAVEPGTWPRAGEESGPVRRVQDYVRAHYDRELCLAELAAVACLSPFHLVRVFQRRVGVTPHEYLTQIRVERARVLLRTDARLADVAAETGFADQSHLTRLFKKRFGLTPGKYRNILQNS